MPVVRIKLSSGDFYSEVIRSVVDKHNRKCGFVEGNSGRFKHLLYVTTHFNSNLKSIKEQ